MDTLESVRSPQPRADAAAGDPFPGRKEVTVRAAYIGERIELRSLETGHRLATGPLVLAAGRAGCAAVLRYGVVVHFGLEPVEEAAFVENLRAFVRAPFEEPETEEVTLRLDPDAPGIAGDGIVLLDRFGVERLQIVADILGKSLLLAHYEEEIAEVFDRIEPLAESLHAKGRGATPGRLLLRHLGGSLLTQYKMIGRAEVLEKPEILWEMPSLERLYLRLEDEFEVRERHFALERKLDLVSRTAQALLELLHVRRSLRVEWYIVFLILVEIVLTLYAMFVQGSW